MRAVETEGKTEDEAVEAALSQLGVARDQVDVDVLSEEHRGGILGFLGQSVVRVRVSVKEGGESEVTAAEREPEETSESEVAEVESVGEPSSEESESTGEPSVQAEPPVEAVEPEQAAEEEPVAEPEEVEVEEPGEEAEPGAALEAELDEDFDWSEEALLLAQDLLDAMGLDLSATIAEVDGHDVLLEVEGPDLGILIGRQGATINAFQYLINVILNRQCPAHLRIVIDGEGYRSRRERTLIRMARNAAERAKRTGREVRMEPLRSFERRIVHLALQEDPDVFTYSEGEEPYRRVLVAPSQRDDDLLDATEPAEAVSEPPSQTRANREPTPAADQEDDFERRWLEEDELDEHEGVDYEPEEGEALVSPSPEPTAGPENDLSEGSDNNQATDEPVIT